MNSKFYSRLIIAASVVGVLSPLAQSVKADEIMEVRRTTTTTTTTSDALPDRSTVIERSSVIEGVPVIPLVPGNRVIVTEQVMPLAMSDARWVLETVDMRRAQLDKQIVDARTAGTLTEAQASDYRRELDRIGAELTFLKSGNTSLSRAIVVGQDLDALTVRMKSVITTIAFVPIIEGSHFTIYNGRIIQLDEPAVRRIGLENKILENQAQGRLNYDQANSLRSELNAIAATEDAYRVKGPLTDSEARIIYKSMDRVAVQLDTYAHLR